jgi:hypothetical protein
MIDAIAHTAFGLSMIIMTAFFFAAAITRN